jgi:multiple sugar transport system substrate-binding protein
LFDKKFLTILLTLIFLLFLVAGMGAAQKDVFATSKITLKLGAWASSPAEKKIVQNQIAAFKKAVSKC